MQPYSKAPAILIAAVAIFLQASLSLSFAQNAKEHDYLLLATNRTSTMETEMQEAAKQGYMFAGVMGGETSFGGNEVVVVMKRSMADRNSRYDYRLLATTRTSTMQREMQEAGDAGYVYKGWVWADGPSNRLPSDASDGRLNSESTAIVTSGVPLLPDCSEA